MFKAILEVCAGSLMSALNAQKGGAGRIELCDNLAEGGTSPSAGTVIQAFANLKIPVFVLIRPRPGDFLYNDLEFKQMQEDITFCKAHGAEGVVLGILNPDASVDSDRCAELIRIARPMKVTFHRAFDMTREPFQAMEDIIALGIDRILTSGQAASAPEGAGLIANLIRRAGDRIIIMPGGRLNENNIQEFIKKTGAREVHASLRSTVSSKMKFRNAGSHMGTPGNDEYAWMETDADRVKCFIDRLNSI